jgi:UPF0042 nucleotide-binding protein
VAFVSEFLVIAGMSGAGRSVAGDHLEDLGWFVIDNLPPELIPKVAELGGERGNAVHRIVLVVGTGPYHQEVLPALERLDAAAGGTLRVLYLHASTEVLIRRYEESRRRHPLAEDRSLPEAIEAERHLLESVRAMADVVIDTSGLNVHQLRDRVVELFGAEGEDEALAVTVQSFGYKHGLPVDADIVLDCRFLPNPYWDEDLRDLTGKDTAVAEHVLGSPLAEAFVGQLEGLLDLLLPAFAAEGKSFVTVSLGCTGGRHRSVALTEHLAELLRQRGVTPRVVHRDLPH